MENIITLTILIMCLCIAILLKGVDVTCEKKNIINQHMSWSELILLLKEDK